MTDFPSSPSTKRIKLDPEHGADEPGIEGPDQSPSEDDNCSICLQKTVDRTVIPNCSHDFCFECILIWSEQSRRCPLCSQGIGEYLIHSIRSRYDYRKHFLIPLSSSPRPQSVAPETLRRTRSHAQRRRQERDWGRRDREDEETRKLERSIAVRRWIYKHDLYAKHIASNAYTKYKPYPTPEQFSASPDLISRTTTFLRRELQVWEGLDVEFLTTLIISLMKSIDIRSESAVKLIAEFLDLDAPYTPGGRHTNAEHFAHEVYSYVRSPHRDLFVYDSVAQYDTPGDVSPPPEIGHGNRWRSPSVAREGSHSPDSQTRRRRSASPDRGEGTSRRTLPDTQPVARDAQTRPIDIPQHNSNTPTTPRGQTSPTDAPATLSEVVKGKSRVDALIPSGNSTEMTPQPNGQLPYIQGPGRALTRPPRNHTLQESVRAHLGQNLVQQTSGSANTKRGIAPPVSASANHPNFTSLLSRVSDPATPQPETQGSTYSGGNSPNGQDEGQTEGAPIKQEGAHLNIDPLGTSDLEPAQAIIFGNRTRQNADSCATPSRNPLPPPPPAASSQRNIDDSAATGRHASLTEDEKTPMPSNVVPIERLQIDAHDVAHVSAPPRPLESSSIWTTDHVKSASINLRNRQAHATQPEKASDVRTRLLARLDQERQNARRRSGGNLESEQVRGVSSSSGGGLGLNNSGSGESLKSHRPRTDGDPKSPSGVLTDQEDAQKREAQLKQRALLQRRLLAEKRRMGST